MRVMVPYLIIASTWYGIKYIIIEHDIQNFLYEISLLSFWKDHLGAWYVAMLIPLYLVFPFLFDWIEVTKNNKTEKSIICIIAAVIFSFIICLKSPKLYTVSAK